MHQEAMGTSQHAAGWTAGVLLIAVIGLLVASALVRPRAEDGLRIQPWSSEQMMQTLPASELRRDPLRALWYLHKQPPVFDAIRAVIANLAPSGVRVGRVVDTWLYLLWAVVYGLTAMLVYRWVRSVSSVSFALAASFAWMLHPAAIAYATLLESTALSALLVLWLFFELRNAPSSRGAAIRLAIAAVLLVYTRTVFQWYFVPLLAVCLWLQRVPLRRGLAIVAVVAALTGGLVAKQYVLFGTTSTSTFTGHHYCGLLWHEPTLVEVLERANTLDYQYPTAARSRDPNNDAVAAVGNLVRTQLCREYAIEHPEAAVRAIGRSLSQNVRKYLLPSSRYTHNLLVDILPWREAYDFVFSGWRLMGLLALGALVRIAGLWRAESPLDVVRRWGASVLIFSYVLGMTNLGNRGDWVEADRIKFLLEPVFFTFLACSIWELPGLLRSRRASQRNLA